MWLGHTNHHKAVQFLIACAPTLGVLVRTVARDTVSIQLGK